MDRIVARKVIRLVHIHALQAVFIPKGEKESVIVEYRNLLGVDLCHETGQADRMPIPVQAIKCLVRLHPASQEGRSRLAEDDGIA